MLDQAWIFKKNGVVLWSRSLAAVKGDFVGGSAVNHLVRTVLLEEKAGAAQVGKRECVCACMCVCVCLCVVVVVVLGARSLPPSVRCCTGPSA